MLINPATASLDNFSVTTADHWPLILLQITATTVLTDATVVVVAAVAVDNSENGNS